MATKNRKLIRVRLLKDHEHNGRQYMVGDFIDIQAFKLPWFVLNNIAAQVNPPDSKPDKSAPAQQTELSSNHP